MCKTGTFRLVYSLRQSLHSLPSPSRTLGRTVRIPLHSTLAISIRFLPTRMPHAHPFLPCRQATPILSSEVCSLGELSLVLELGYEPQLCSVGNIVTSMGASIYPSHAACAVQPREASANASILCRWGGEDACPVGGGRTADATASLSVPLLRWTGHLPVQYRSRSFHFCGLVDRILLICIRIDHTAAINTA